MGFPTGYSKEVLAEVDSTNAEAARIAGAVSGPTWILALKQTAARGRRGRAWVNPDGNFAGTLVLPINEPPQSMALRSFVASLALYDAIVAVSGRAGGLSLKWPNDVLLNGGKIAGILLETIARKGDAFSLAIGIGVNLKAAPATTEVEAHAVRPVSLLSETGAIVSPEEFLEALASAYAKYENQFRDFGFAPIREAWLLRAARLGDVITARLPNQEVTGTFETVDESGSLVLKTPKGCVAIAAADIYF